MTAVTSGAVTAVASDLVRLYADSDALALAELVRTRQVSPLELVETAIGLIVVGQAQG